MGKCVSHNFGHPFSLIVIYINVVGCYVTTVYNLEYFVYPIEMLADVKPT